jgi:hypothetical protein
MILPSIDGKGKEGSVGPSLERMEILGQDRFKILKVSTK